MIEYNNTQLYFNSNVYNNTTVSETPLTNATQRIISWNLDHYPIRDSLRLVIPLTVLYSVIFVSGMLGNVITCIVIARNRAMHTATNYYLFSLAISDLLLLISGMPVEIYALWYRYPYPFGEPVCIFQGFAAETSANATVLTITAFTAERYIAICHPFLSHTMSKLSRAIKFILGIWILAMGLAIPQILDWGIERGFGTCGVKSDLRKHVFTISTILCFVFPMTVITIFYVLIGLQLRRSKIVGRGTTANGNSIKLKTKNRIPSQKNILLTIDRAGKTNTSLSPVPSHGLLEAVYTPSGKHDVAASQRILNNSCDEGRKNYSHKGNMGTRHVVNMLVAVVVAFFVCWAPHHAQRLFAMYADNRYSDIYDVLTHISGVLYFVSTCINPFLYNIMSYKFREAFKGTCATCLHGRETSGYGVKGALSRNISQRSTSHSAHTCSSACSSYVQQSQNATYILDQDFALLKCSIKRPLTVKFKKSPRPSTTTVAAQQHQQQHHHHQQQLQRSFDLADSESFQFKTNFKFQSQLDMKRTCNANVLQHPPNNEHHNDYSIFTMDNYTTDFQEMGSNMNVFHDPLSNHDGYMNDGASERCRSFCYPINKRDNSSNVNTSPYDSPELTANSRKLEESLQNILKDLVKTDNVLQTDNIANSGRHYNSFSIVKGFPKSKSVTNLVGCRMKKSNRLRKSIGLRDPF